MIKDKRGYSIRIFLPGGEPDGVRIVEKDLWTGQGLVCPRSLFADTNKRDEFKKTGVYVLTGFNEEGDPVAYIGEGDPIFDRLVTHHRNKDFWTTAYLFTSKDTNLNKAHVQYLESRLIQLAKKVKQCELDNQNTPTEPSLSEADTAYTEGFLEEMLLCFPLLGVNIFSQPGHLPEKNRVRYFFINRKNISAKGYETGNGFVVCKGSQCVLVETNSCGECYRNMRKKLLEQGIVEKNGNALVFTQDYTFNTPSSAATVILGNNTNGYTIWKTKEGKTLGDLRKIETEPSTLS